MRTEISDRIVSVMAGGLRDFGYPDVTSEEVRDWCDALVRGEEPSDVCAMFVKGWLEDAGAL
jgi:hypothetical protein